MLFGAKPGLNLTNDSHSLPAGHSVGAVGMCTYLFHVNLADNSGSLQEIAIVPEPDPAVTLQTGLGCRDAAEQGHQHQQHLASAPPRADQDESLWLL